MREAQARKLTEKLAQSRMRNERLCEALSGIVDSLDVLDQVFEKGTVARGVADGAFSPGITEIRRRLQGLILRSPPTTSDTDSQR